MTESFKLAACQQPGEPSSRSRADWAGWSREGDEWKWKDDANRHGDWERRLAELEADGHRRWRDFSWLSTRALLDSANDQIAKTIHDLVNARRQRWIAAQRAAGAKPHDVLIAPGASFLILGDPGEADASQYAVVAPMLTIDRDENLGSDFMVILSDVIYPAGDVNDYVNGFYEPYKEYEKPIYALPGNHDWYDGLNGFMFHFCGAETLPPTEFRWSSYSAAERVARMMWRQADRPDRPDLLAHRYRDATPWEPKQPAPYWAMDIEDHLRLVAIDTGIKGTLDREQGEWLLRVSKGEIKKVLLTGKPLWVDGEYKPGEIEWGDRTPDESLLTVDDVVRRGEHNYVAAIGGDVHNYQRHTVTITEPGKEPRPIEYVVAGGSGAYMSATDRIGKVANTARHARPAEPKPKDLTEVPPEVGPIGEEQFRCYPTRGDSIAYYVHTWGRSIAVLFFLAVFLGSVALGALIAWDRYDDVGAETVGEIVVATLVGALVVPGLVALLVFAIRKTFPEGYRLTGVALLVGPALAVVAVVLSNSLDAWDWGWRAALIGLGTVIAPLVFVAIAYYGLGSRLARQLAGCLIAVSIAGLFVFDFDDAEVAVLSVSAGLVAVALLLVALAIAVKSERLRSAGRWIWSKSILAVPITTVAYLAPLIAVAFAFPGTWAIEAIIAAALSLTVFIGFALALLIGVGTFPALLFLGRGEVDPDAVLTELRSRGIDDGAGSRTREPSWATKQIVDLFLSKAKPRVLARTKMSEIGNSATPPMFKSFVRAALVDDGKRLELSCYGVTGWEEHDTQVPREDCVRIDLN